MKPFRLTKDNIRLGTSYMHISKIRNHTHFMFKPTYVSSNVAVDIPNNKNYSLDTDNSYVLYYDVYKFKEDLLQWLRE